MHVLASLVGYKSFNATMIYIDTNDQIKRQVSELDEFFYFKKFY